MRSLEWALIQYDRCPYKKGKFTHRDGWAQKEDEAQRYKQKTSTYEQNRDTQKDFPSQPSKGTNPTDTVTLEF